MYTTMKIVGIISVKGTIHDVYESIDKKAVSIRMVVYCDDWLFFDRVSCES